MTAHACSRPLGAAALLVLSFLALAGQAHAFSFGVPGPGLPPDGWFILVGKDALGEDQSNYFGDITRDLTIHIEVTGTTIDLCVFDPGTYSPLLGVDQLDFRFEELTPPEPPAQMTFELFAPGGGVPIKADTTSFGADTLTSDRSLFCFYQSAIDGAVAPGTYRFVVRMPDGPGLDEDVNVFGVRTQPDYDGFVYHATVGHSTFTGAGLNSDTVRLFPWLAQASAGDDDSGVASCGVDIITYDLDGADFGVNPPEVALRSRLQWPDPTCTGGVSGCFQPSPDGGFFTETWADMAGYNDASDHGIYTLEMSRLGAGDAVLEMNRMPSACVPVTCPAPGVDFNAFSTQVYNFKAQPPVILFSDYPVVPPDRAASHNARRLYLPLQGGAAPVKPWVGHRIVNPPAGGAYPALLTTQVDVELRIANPTTQPLTNVIGQTVVGPSAEISAPRNVAAMSAAGGTATANGKTIDFSFPILFAGETAVVSYTMDFTPATTGSRFVTGDGTSFSGGASPTVATWDTVFAPIELAAPCMIQAFADVAPCTVTAVGSGPASPVCQRQPFDLDGGASTRVSCTTLEYRWLGPGLPASPPFTTNPRVTTSSTTAGPNVYSLEVRCQGILGCTDSTTVSVGVSTGELPAADAGPDVSRATCDLPFTIGTPGDLARFLYAWSPAGPLADATVAEPQFTATAPGVYDFTLTVTSIADAACVDTDTVRVTLVDGLPTGRLGNRLAAVRDRADVVLSWPLGVISVDRYNVHRTEVKAQLDKANYLAPVLSGVVTVGSHRDGGAAMGPPDLYHYEVFGADCAGTSVIN